METDLFLKIATASVALYGAVLSTYNLVASRREKSKRVAVELSMGFLAWPGRTSPGQIILKASNHGHRTVRLAAWLLRLPDGRQLLLPESGSEKPFPCDLPDGHSVTCWLDAATTAEVMRHEGYSGAIKVRGEVQDGTGRRFSSKAFPFDVSEWQSAG